MSGPSFTHCRTSKQTTLEFNFDAPGSDSMLRDSFCAQECQLLLLLLCDRKNSNRQKQKFGRGGGGENSGDDIKHDMKDCSIFYMR